MSQSSGAIRDRIEERRERPLDEVIRRLRATFTKRRRRLRTTFGKINQFIKSLAFDKRKREMPTKNTVEDNTTSRDERRDASTQTEDEQTVDSSLRVERRDPATQEPPQIVDVVEEEGQREAQRTTATPETGGEIRAYNDGREGEEENNERRNADRGEREEGRRGAQRTTATSVPRSDSVIDMAAYPNPSNQEVPDPLNPPYQEIPDPDGIDMTAYPNPNPSNQENPEDPEPSNQEGAIFIVNPNGRLYQFWSYFIIILAVCSSFFTPLEFAFFTDLPEGVLYIIDLVVAFFFFMDLLVQFLIPYRDDRTERMVYQHGSIALRYLKSPSTYSDLLGCFPWYFIYTVCWRNEGVRYTLWIRLYRVSKVVKFFQNIGINYKFIRILKHLVILFYYVHTAGCIFYHLATIVPESCEGYTWIGSLMLGKYDYSHFRQIGFWRRYLTSLYFALVTMSTVGYGDVHAVSAIEMIFTMIYISLSMVVLPYWLSSALMVFS